MLLLLRPAWQPTYVICFIFVIRRIRYHCPMSLPIRKLTYYLCMYWSSRSVFKEQSYQCAFFGALKILSFCLLLCQQFFEIFFELLVI